MIFFKFFFHFGTCKYVMRKRALVTMRKVLSKCLKLIFYSLMGTCSPNFEQKHLLLFHEFLAFEKEATLVDFGNHSFFLS